MKLIEIKAFNSNPVKEPARLPWASGCGHASERCKGRHAHKEVHNHGESDPQNGRRMYLTSLLRFCSSVLHAYDAKGRIDN